LFENENPTLGDVASTGTAEPTQDLVSSEAAPEQPDQASDLLDLDSFDENRKLKLQEKEWTAKEIRDAILRQEDYTRKTQKLAEERKYYANLRYDLANVKRNPALAAEFKKVYPKEFHDYLSHILPDTQTAKPQAENQAKPALDPQVAERLERVEKYYNDQTAKAAKAEVDSNCEKFSQKYPSVKGRYEALAMNILEHRLSEIRKDDPDAVLTEADWDRAYKSVHDENQKLAEQFFAEKVKKQKQTNQQVKDVAPGGGIPGQAPRKARTIKEATAFALQELEG